MRCHGGALALCGWLVAAPPAHGYHIGSTVNIPRTGARRRCAVSDLAEGSKSDGSLPARHKRSVLSCESRSMSSTAIALLAGAAAGTAVLVAVAYKSDWRWTGFPREPGYEKARRDPAGPTLWDWLQLLVVPLVLALAAFALNDAQTRRQQRQENDRAHREQARAVDDAREQTLRGYLQRMSDLMLHSPLGSPARRRSPACS